MGYLRLFASPRAAVSGPSMTDPSGTGRPAHGAQSRRVPGRARAPEPERPSSRQRWPGRFWSCSTRLLISRAMLVAVVFHDHPLVDVDKVEPSDAPMALVAHLEIEGWLADAGRDGQQAQWRLRARLRTLAHPGGRPPRAELWGSARSRMQRATPRDASTTHGRKDRARPGRARARPQLRPARPRRARLPAQ
jgi:hypothetical protein